MEQLSTLKTFYNGLHHHFYHQDGHLNIFRLESINNDIANAIFPATTHLPDHIWESMKRRIEHQNFGHAFFVLAQEILARKKFFPL